MPRRGHPGAAGIPEGELSSVDASPQRPGRPEASGHVTGVVGAQTSCAGSQGYTGGTIAPTTCTRAAARAEKLLEAACHDAAGLDRKGLRVFAGLVYLLKRFSDPRTDLAAGFGFGFGT